MTPESFQEVADPRTYADEARAAGKLVVWIPAVRSKEKLLAIIASGLRFPSYFGGNWDALEECLQDLSWLPAAAQVVIVHERLPFGGGENRQVYCAILAAASKRLDGRMLEVVVPIDGEQ